MKNCVGHEQTFVQSPGDLEPNQGFSGAPERITGKQLQKIGEFFPGS